MSSPLVSILICTRDRPEQLQQCLSSVLQLDYPAYEVVVVDNASEHFSIPKMEFQRPARFYCQPVPGLSYARNLAVSMARGEILAFIDDDAVAHTKWLKAAMLHFDNPRIGSVTGRVLPLESTTDWHKRLSLDGWFPNSSEAKLYNHSNYDPRDSSPGIGCNFFVRKSIFECHNFSAVFNVGTPVGGNDEHYLFYQMIRDGWQILYEPQAIVYHENAVTEQQYERKVTTYIKSHSAYLIWFLIAEKKERLLTLKHVIRKLFSLRSGDGPRSTLRLKMRGCLLSPFALIQSLRLARRNLPLASKQGKLLAEFP